jgi:hypothetical protein
MLNRASDFCDDASSAADPDISLLVFSQKEDATF